MLQGKVTQPRSLHAPLEPWGLYL